MRYADGPTVEVSTHVAAPPAAVWAVVTDINLPAAFSEEFQGGDWIEGAIGPAVGARFVGRNCHPAIGTWETTCVIVECQPEHVLAYTVGDADEPSALWRYTLEPDGAGTTLTQAMRMGPARSGLNIAIDAMPEKEERIIARRLEEHRANMARTLEGVRSLVEGSA